MEIAVQQSANTPKLINAEDERELRKRLAEDVQASAPRIRALQERNRAVQVENPGLPSAVPKPPGPAAEQLPTKFSWEQHGGVSKIQDQNPAGTCWVFAHIGALESDYLRRYGNAYDLAEQDLIDCGRDGADARIAQGVRFEFQNPYQKMDAPTAPTAACRCDHTPFAVLGRTYADPDQVISEDPAQNQPPPVEDIKNAVFHHGPVVVAMYIPTGSAFGGTQVFKETIPLTFSPTRNNGSHILLIVGWDDDQGAWRLKNSWGTGWGDNGFGWIAYGSNKIGMCAYYYTLYSPDLLTTSIWEQSNAEEYQVDGWPYDYFEAERNALAKDGWRLHQLRAGVSDGRVLYSAVWRKTDSDELIGHDLTYKQFQTEYDELWKQGWRIYLLTNYVLGDAVYYSAVWRKGDGDETQYYELRYDDFQKKYDELWKQGMRLEILSNVVKGGDVFYQAVWRKGNQAETQFYGLDYASFQKKYDELWKEGWRVYLIQNYRVGNKIYFNATWRQGQAGEMQWYGLDPRSQGHKEQEMRRDGWRLRLLDIY